ncbi:hypothetical protein MFIFM68171_06698 [Madurella fahalii]|uniref:Protein kinase domain-containing protein n=1 Tax=Madurella fahalii TaxID=1157608 RepID=A0ABQ0GFE7_9PEZI
MDTNQVYQIRVDPPDDSGSEQADQPDDSGSEQWTCVEPPQTIVIEVEKESVSTDEASLPWDDSAIQIEDDDREARYDVESLSSIDSANNGTLADTLRNHELKGFDGKRFWPTELLRRIMSRERLHEELERNQYQRLSMAKHDILTAILDRNYIRIFALLLLVEKGHEIQQLIKQEASDSILPIRRQPGCKRGNIRFLANENGQGAGPPRKVEFIDKWLQHEREFFEDQQWSVIPPYLEFPKHYTFESKRILPWRVVSQHEGGDEDPPGLQFERQGAYGTVTKIIIDPDSHGFCHKLKEIKLEECQAFALKRLNQNNKEERGKFHNEHSQLRLFGGAAHRHLVTLLASFEFQGYYHLIFPWADYSLEEYWERESPKGKKGIVRWVAKQVAGLMAAVDTIHDPPSQVLLPEKKYGRHSDIKPDNILWFRATDDPHGILVLADLGLSSLNREVSRSNMPSDKAPRVPGYRPPECDIDGAKVSRAFDIWTMGCLFTELLTWLLGGRKLLDEFERVRKSQDYLEGVNSLLFFQLMEKEDRSGHVVQVKRSVSEWFVKLHGLKTCTQFAHEALDIIENEMLVVISEERTRTSSTPLSKKFKRVYQKCLEDTAYETEGLARNHELQQFDPVEAKVKKDAPTLNGPLPLHRGTWSRSRLSRD